MRFEITPHTMEFIKSAKTSRGEYNQKISHLVRLSDGIFDGFGEAAPLPDLSIDGTVDFYQKTESLLDINLEKSDIESLLEHWEPGTSNSLPSLRFALHCAWQHLQFLQSQPNKAHYPNKPKFWIQNDFTMGKVGIPINGLVWMNDIQSMYEEAMLKISVGFNCIKFKVGALDFDEECKLIEKIRKTHSAFQLEIRLDANGGFDSDLALEQIQELHRFEIHSIEQPVKSGYPELDKICQYSKIDIALDEELIGLHPDKSGNNPINGKSLLTWAKPKYIILKPTLLGGIDLADRWINIASGLNIGWWSTSALEGNVGLAAIAQWVSKYHPLLPQGLGTGSLFKENYDSQTRVIENKIWYLP
jgi:O-succinylbenzoate synthase